MTHTLPPKLSRDTRPAAALVMAAALAFSAAALAEEALPPPFGFAAAQEDAARQRPPVTSTPIPSSASSPAAAARTPGRMDFVTLGRITFDSGKWQLGEAARRALDAMAAYLAANPGAQRLLLEGHTDRVGSLRYNDALSAERATAVQGYLIGVGVDPQLIHWKGVGKRAPADEEWTPHGRGRNRQVELFAVYR